MKRILMAVAAALLLLTLTACDKLDTKKAIFTSGTRDGNVHTSEFAGFSYTLPTGWSFETKEQAAEKTGLTVDNFTQEDTVYDSFITMCDMYATPDPADGQSHYLLIDNLRSYNGWRSLTVDKYLELLCRPKSDKEESNLRFSEPFDVVLAGQTYRTVEAEITEKGIWQRYYARQIEGCILLIVTVDTQQPDEKAFASCFAMT